MDTVALLAVCAALRAEFALMDISIASPEKNITPVLEACKIERDTVAESLIRLETMKGRLVLKEEEDLNPKTKAKLEAELAESIASAQEAYFLANDRLLAKAKYASSVYKSEKEELSQLLARLNAAFPLPLLSTVVHGATTISGVGGVTGLITPGALYKALLYHHTNRVPIGVVEAVAMYAKAAGQLLQIGNGATILWQNFLKDLRKTHTILDGRVSVMTPPQVAEIVLGTLRKVGQPATMALVSDLTTAFPYDLSDEKLKSDTRTFADLFEAFNSSPIMLALQNVHSAAPPLRGPREEGPLRAKKALVPGASVGDAMPGICFEFANTQTCSRGDACRWRHVQVVAASDKK